MFTLLEQSDVFVDAACGDQHSQLLFISVFGRDTSIQQFMARLHESDRQGGIEKLSVKTRPASDCPSRTAVEVLVGDPKRLTKLTGRMPRTGLLGNLVHAWIFDGKLIELDHTARSGWLFGRKGAQQTAEVDQLAAWQLVQDLAPVPLMPHWAVPVLGYLQARRALFTPPSVGPIRVLRVQIPEDFPFWISERVRDGELGEQPTGLARLGPDALSSSSSITPALAQRRG